MPRNYKPTGRPRGRPKSDPQLRRNRTNFTEYEMKALKADVYLALTDIKGRWAPADFVAEKAELSDRSIRRYRADPAYLRERERLHAEGPDGPLFEDDRRRHSELTRQYARKQDQG